MNRRQYALLVAVAAMAFVAWYESRRALLAVESAGLVTVKKPVKVWM